MSLHIHKITFENTLASTEKRLVAFACLFGLKHTNKHTGFISAFLKSREITEKLPNYITFGPCTYQMFVK